MVSGNIPDVTNNESLYNSKIINIFIEYLRDHYSDVDVDSLLDYAGMTRYEVEDQGHWFSQAQVDRFHEVVSEKTGNKHIAREAGRYATDSQASGALRQYALGFITLSSVYRMLEKQASNLSRGFRLKTKRLARNKVEVTVSPKPGVNEKPYQCENRIGMFESMAKLFTKNYAKVEHSLCFHKGDESCIYIITWGRTSSLVWKVISNYSLLISIIVSALFFFLLPATQWVTLVLGCIFITGAFWLRSELAKNKELTETIENQGDAAKDLLSEMNIRHENALLIHEIGQATSTILDTDKLLKTITNVMEKRLDFNRGIIMLANKERTRLIYTAGYGYSEDKEELLRGTEFNLANPLSKGIAVQAFKKKKPFLINDTSQIEKDLSERSLEFVRKTGALSFICVPIVYENDALGILAVDNVESKRPLTRSDISLLMGVASQAAVSIVNAMSFQKLQESERKYRDLVENANSIILRMDPSGNIAFFNEFAQRFFGYNEDEILGRNVVGTILPNKENSKNGLKEVVKSLSHDPELQVVTENETLLRNGEKAWVAWTYKPIFENSGNIHEILCIGNDITQLKHAEKEKKDLEAQLQRAQKMEAIGTLAGGIAHDFNNVLQAVFSNIQIIMMGMTDKDPAYSRLDSILKSVQRASDLTKRLLIFGRKVESSLSPINLKEEVLQVSKMLEQTIPKMIEIELALEEEINVVNADAVQIEQILMNLGINARDAMPDGGRLRFELENVNLDSKYCKTHLGPTPGEYVQLSISDTGHGMGKETLDHMFEPFFTTKEPSKGTGLGLSTVYGIVKSHGGYITCESATGEGTTFRILFPVLKENNQIHGKGEIDGNIKGGDETILLVDDESNIREAAVELLVGLGYRVLTAPDGESALSQYEKNWKEIDLIILDLIMPGMGGRRCLEALLKINPKVKVVIASGESVDLVSEKALAKQAKCFICKPYGAKKMFNVLRETLEED
ncbi:ATP-binding protein [Thermodesulfobacteriota bacterium]